MLMQAGGTVVFRSTTTDESFMTGTPGNYPPDSTGGMLRVYIHWYPQRAAAPVGWICPRCGCGVAPHATRCDCIRAAWGPTYTITCDSITLPERPADAVQTWNGFEFCSNFEFWNNEQDAQYDDMGDA